LETIAISGFSAGCQLALRWAFFAQADFGKVRLVVSDCNTYMYNTAERPAESCRPLEDTESGHWCDEFEVPNATEYPPMEYNAYKYGTILEGTRYVDRGYRYLLPFQAASAIERAAAAFYTKDIRFVFGTQDVCNCRDPEFNNSEAFCFPRACAGHCADTFPDGTCHNLVDIRPAAMLQGSNRLQRGLNYAAYLQTKPHPGNRKAPDFFVGGHDDKGFFNSVAFKAWAFGIHLDEAAASEPPNAWRR